ncbi:MAG: FtsX-like permease family protein [Terriglobia bacterium]
MRILKKLGFVLGMGLAMAVPTMLLFVLPGWWLLACIAVLGMWLGLLRIGQQTWSVTRMGVATIPRRFGASSVVVVGIASVVAVLVAMLAMGAGFESTLKQSGTDDTAIILQAGARSELNSSVTHEAAAVVSQSPQALRNAEGQPIASPELVVIAMLRRKNGHDANVVIRGVGERVWDLWPHINITAGRKFKTGLQELIVGKGIYEQFVGTQLGSTLTLNGQPWNVVGIFDSGDARNSEIWAGTDVVGSVFHRESNKNSLSVRLTDPLSLEALKTRLARDPRFKVEAETTRQYFSRESASFTRIIHILGLTVGAIMAFGAVFGVLNTMQSAVAGRAREIATLRAIGFRRTPLIVSVLLETLLLAVSGGAIGALLSWAVFDGFIASTVGANSGQMVFAIKVSPALAWIGFKWALAIAIIGGLFPAVRAARMPITNGLRQL